MHVKNNVVRRSAIAVLALAVGTCAVGYAAAPAIPSATVSSLSPSQTGELKAYVQYWVDRLRVHKSYSAMAHDADRLLKPLKMAGVQPSAVFSYDYGSMVSRALRPLLSDPHRQLMVAVVLGRIDDLSTQGSLEVALKSQNAGVRYWGAEGLMRILPQLESIPPAYQEAENHLIAALKVEKSPMVAAKIATALAQFSPVPAGVVASLNRILGSQAKNFSLRPPTTVGQTGDLAEAFAIIVNAHAQLSDAEKTAAATNLTELLSYTCQYWALKRLDRAQTDMAPAAMRNFADALNALTGTTDFTLSGVSANSNADAVLLEVNELTGSQGERGTIQKIFPKVPIPPRVGH